VTNRIFWIFVSLALTVTFSAGGSIFAQTAQTNLLRSLPPSDAVALVDVKRVINEAVPKVLASNPTKLNEVNAQLERFKTRTGLDPHSFNTLAVGMRYTYPRAGITKVESVGLAEGTFNPAALAAAGRVAADGKYREEKYKEKVIYIFRLEDHIKLFGVLDLRFSELAVSPLTNTTLALGDLESVRAVIDLGNAPQNANAELISLALRQPNAIVSFGGNVSPALLENLRIGNDAIAKDVSSVKQVYGSVGMSAADLELFAAARTTSADAARNLGETVEGLKQLGALFIHRLPAAKALLARSALTNLKVTTSGNELQISTGVAQADLAPLVTGRE